MTGLRRHARILVPGWVLGVIPLLAVGLGYLMLHLPEINRALVRSGGRQAHLTSAAISTHHYALAAVDAVGFALLALSLAGSLYITAGLVRRMAAMGLRWSAGHPGRRVLVTVAGLAGLPGRAGQLLGAAGPVPRLVGPEPGAPTRTGRDR